MQWMDHHISLDAMIQSSKILGGAGVDPAFTAKQVYYVDSNAAGNGDVAGSGKTPDRPFATIHGALGLVDADTLIEVLPGHAEDIVGAGGFDCLNNGVWVRGRGWGARRPTVTFKTSTAAQVLIDKSSIVLQNLLFLNEIDACVMPIRVTGDDCALLGIEFREDGAYEAVDYINIAAGAERCLIDGLRLIGEGSGDNGQAAINFQSANQLILRNFYLEGNFTAGAIENVTNAAASVLIDGGRGSVIWNKNASDLAIVTVSTCSGTVMGRIGVRLADDAANVTECIDLGDMQMFDDAIQIVNADAEGGVAWNGAHTTDA